MTDFEYLAERETLITDVINWHWPVNFAKGSSSRKPESEERAANSRSRRSTDAKKTREAFPETLRYQARWGPQCFSFKVTDGHLIHQRVKYDIYTDSP